MIKTKVTLLCKLYNKYNIGSEEYTEVYRRMDLANEEWSRSNAPCINATTIIIESKKVD